MLRGGKREEKGEMRKGARREKLEKRERWGSIDR